MAHVLWMLRGLTENTVVVQSNSIRDDFLVLNIEPEASIGYQDDGNR